MAKRSSLPVHPQAPVDLLAVAVGDRQVILAWTECGGGGVGFCIERSVCHSPCSSFAEIGRVGQHVAAFRDGAVEPCTTYRYRVLAWNAFGASSPSNVVEVTTPPAGKEPSADQE